MEIKLSDKEKQFFEKIEDVRALCNNSSAMPEEYFNNLMIKNILYNLLEKKSVHPVNGALDALTDEIDYYLNRSFEEFVQFLMSHVHLNS